MRRPADEIDQEIATRLRPARAGSIPFDGSDRTGMPDRADLGRAERRAFLGIAPRRSLWPEVERLDQRAGELANRQGEAQERIRSLTEQRANAPTVDAAALAQWELGGRRGAQPEPTADALDRRIAEAERERDGLQAAVDVAQETKAAFVEQHRDRLVAVAEQQAEQAHARMLELIDELEETRTNLLDLEQARLWAALYPNALAGSESPTGLIFRGLAKPIRDTLNLNPAPQIQAAGILELLRRDADALRSAATAEQRVVLDGRDPKPVAGATWANTPEAIAQDRQEKQKARERYMREWGQVPGW